MTAFQTAQILLYMYQAHRSHKEFVTAYLNDVGISIINLWIYSNISISVYPFRVTQP
jgi:hypothetical protein